MLVAIPSKGRAGKTKSDRYMPESVMFVPELEAEAYRRSTLCECRAVPDTVRGITSTRNWILDNADDSWVVFIDDDLKNAGWRELLHSSSKGRKLSAQDMIGEWIKLFEITEELSLKIWGLATQGAKRSIYPWKPFLFHTYVTASCMGIINDGLRFDESFLVKEDYELCLRCIRDHGGVLGARYLYWENEHWTGSGGCSDYRTQEMEAEAIGRLMSMYPGFIRKVTRGGSGYSIDLDF